MKLPAIDDSAETLALFFNRLPVGGCLLLIVLCAGCGERGLQPIAVHGQITYGGGEWPKPGCLYFTSQPAAGVITRPGMAVFGPDGRFQVTTFRPDDGLLPGEYQVSVECWEVDLGMNPADMATELRARASINRLQPAG